MCVCVSVCVRVCVFVCVRVCAHACLHVYMHAHACMSLLRFIAMVLLLQASLPRVPLIGRQRTLQQVTLLLWQLPDVGGRRDRRSRQLLERQHAQRQCLGPKVCKRVCVCVCVCVTICSLHCVDHLQCQEGLCEHPKARSFVGCGRCSAQFHCICVKSSL